MASGDLPSRIYLNDASNSLPNVKALDKAAFLLELPLFPSPSSIGGGGCPPLFCTLFFLHFSILSPTDPDILNGVYMSEALNPIFVDNFERDPTLTWQYFGSSTGFFRLYPGEKAEIGFSLSQRNAVVLQDRVCAMEEPNLGRLGAAWPHEGQGAVSKILSAWAAAA